MAFYLSMDGVDDKIVTPSLTFTEIQYEISLPADETGTAYFIDARDSSNTSPYVLLNTSGKYQFAGTNVYEDGVQVSSSTTSPSRDTRMVVKMNPLSAPITRNAVYFGSRWTSADFMKVKIYSIKIYNSATLVAHYDMTLGNVQDQSGNGRHATLTGGTWVSDGTTHLADATLTGVGTLNTSAIRIAFGDSSLAGVGTLDASGLRIVSADTVLAGIGTLSASPTRIVDGEAALVSIGTISADGTLVIVGYAGLTGIGTLTIIQGDPIIGNVEMAGQRTLYVYLVGEQELNAILQGQRVINVNLKGGL